MRFATSASLPRRSNIKMQATSDNETETLDEDIGLDIDLTTDEIFGELTEEDMMLFDQYKGIYEDYTVEEDDEFTDYDLLLSDAEEEIDSINLSYLREKPMIDKKRKREFLERKKD